VPSSGSFGGGLSTGLGGLAPPPPPHPPLAMAGMVPYSSASIAADYSASVASAYGRHGMTPFNPFSHSRPEELFYGALGRSLQSASAGAHFRPEDNPMALMTNRNLPMAIGSPYHERFLTFLFRFLYTVDLDRSQLNDFPTQLAGIATAVCVEGSFEPVGFD